jgi:hypothetical protein
LGPDVAGATGGKRQVASSKWGLVDREQGARNREQGTRSKQQEVRSKRETRRAIARHTIARNVLAITLYHSELDSESHSATGKRSRIGVRDDVFRMTGSEPVASHPCLLFAVSCLPPAAGRLHKLLDINDIKCYYNGTICIPGWSFARLAIPYQNNCLMRAKDCILGVIRRFGGV